MTYELTQLKELLTKDFPFPAGFSGRGIVISAGGPSLISAYITVRSLRQQACNLPIQIWHLGPQELPAKIVPAFQDWGVKFVDSLEIRKKKPMRCIGGWENKIFSLSWCHFAEVLLLDADNMVLRNPEYLFENKDYKKNGEIFWPDFPLTTGAFWGIKPKAWDLLGLAKGDEAGIETGQILINKSQCWKALMLAYHMNDNSDFFYTHCTHGDTDTYTLAWLLCSLPLNIINKKPLMTHAPIRIQFGPEGEELFQHSRKWSLPAQSNQKLQDFRGEELCLHWLRELEQKLE